MPPSHSLLPRQDRAVPGVLACHDDGFEAVLSATGGDALRKLHGRPDLVVAACYQNHFPSNVLYGYCGTTRRFSIRRQTERVHAQIARRVAVRLPVRHEWDIRERLAVGSPVRGRTILVHSTPDDGRRRERDGRTDASVAAGGEQRGLGAERGPDQGNVVTLRSEQVDGLGEQFDRHLERPRLLSWSAEPPHGQRNGTVPAEEFRPSCLDATA